MTTPTREQLSVWLERAQAEHVEMQVLLERAHEAQAQFAADNQRLRGALEKRGCLHPNCGECNGGEDDSR